MDQNFSQTLHASQSQLGWVGDASLNTQQATNHLHSIQQSPQLQQGRRSSAARPRSSRREPKQLACTSCRRKKVKCLPSLGGTNSCSLCEKLNIQCSVPETDERRQSTPKWLVRDLCAQIAQLQAELDLHKKYCLMGSDQSDWAAAQDEVFSPAAESIKSDSSKGSDNMIVRLCGGQRQLNSDRVGRLRFFGPTSSLHLTESVTSSVLIRESNGKRSKLQWQDDFPLDLQQRLLDLFWTYQHQVLPSIHKEAFLRDMNNGDTKYCSKLLVYCILTRAAAISDQPGLRALALTDDADDDPPFLVRKCVAYLDTELNNPGIATCQSLLLLSEMHCAISDDTKGWMYAGGAGRLAYELGLHSDSTGLSTSLTKVDLEVRQLVFWSCFTLDRQWALYLGRPQCIKLEDVSVKRPGEGLSDVPFEMRIAAAWTNLLEIVGMICDILNGVKTIQTEISTLDQRLRNWHSSLDPDFHYSPQQAPAVMILHMQYAAALILLHRPVAHFGADSAEQTSASESSRQICVYNACLIAQYLQEYNEQHGSVSTMSWVSLHIIATASTTLVANVAERKGNPDSKSQLSCLQTCMRSLNELEKSHVVTRRVRKVIQHAIRLLDLDSMIDFMSSSLSYDTSACQAFGLAAPLMTPTQELGVGSTELETIPQVFQLNELLPVWTQFDMLNSFESYFS